MSMINFRLMGCQVMIFSLPSPHEDVNLRILVSLPSTYPETTPPQLQLLSRYVGAFGADSNLFGSILRTFISVNGVEWNADVCVFDGLQNVLERCLVWYEDRLSVEKAGEIVREDTREQSNTQSASNKEMKAGAMDPPAYENTPSHAVPAGIQIFTAEPITDRKSVFVGRACQISNPSEV